MRQRLLSILAALLMVAGVQQAWAQKQRSAAEGKAKVVLYTTAKGTIELDFADIDSISFSEVSVPVPQWIDLGLPSGTLWATCNVGASSPEEYGDYFAWGETNTKSEYNWSTYKWMMIGESSWSHISKYVCADGWTNAIWYSDGTFIGDGLTELLPADDAATANWGNGWQMPSLAQLQELCNSSYTTTEWTTQNGVTGRRITSKSNGNSLFLPAAGYRDEADLYADTTSGNYWSRSLSPNYSFGACDIIFNSGYIELDEHHRYYGRAVRPVRVR